MLVECLVLVSVLLSFLYLWIKHQQKFFVRHKFLHEKPSFPYGNFRTEAHLALAVDELYRKFRAKAPAFGMHLFTSPVVVITDLDVVQDILINDFSKFTNRGIFLNKRNEPLSCHLMSLEDEEWKNLRQKLVPFFSDHKMEMIFSTLINVSKHMLASLELPQKREQNRDVRDMMLKYATDVIGNVIYGIDMSEVNSLSSKFREMGSKLFEYKTYTVLKFICLLSFKNISERCGVTYIPSDITNFFLGIVRTAVKYRLYNKIERKDALDILLKIEDQRGGKLSMEEIAAQCFMFYFYGFETVACTGAFVLYNLAMHQDVQDNLREEIITVLENHENNISYDATEEMQYLKMVIDETLRLYPPIVYSVRESSTNYKIKNWGNLIIPKDTYVTIPMYSIHRDAKYYPQANVFDPERFNDGNKKNRHPMAYLPFGAGRRNCLAQKFAMIQLKIAIIKLLTNYQIVPNEKTPSPMTFDPMKSILTSEEEMSLTFVRLEANE